MESKYHLFILEGIDRKVGQVRKFQNKGELDNEKLDEVLDQADEEKYHGKRNHEWIRNNERN